MDSLSRLGNIFDELRVPSASMSLMLYELPTVLISESFVLDRQETTTSGASDLRQEYVLCLDRVVFFPTKRLRPI